MRTYLLSSFPSLQPEGSSPLRFAEFMRECTAHLSNSEMEELDAVCAVPPRGTSAFAKEWAKTYGQWQAQNEQERRQRLSLDTAGADDVSVESDQLRGEQQQAWQAANPLAREQALQSSLWNWIENHRRQAPYSFKDLQGYALQLKLLERRELWNENDGLNQFQEHTQSFLEPVLEELRKQDLSA